MDVAACQAFLLHERGSQLLVVNPGSSRLRVGLGSADAPEDVAHVVAYARRGAAPPPPPSTAAAVTDAAGARDAEREAACRQAEALLRLPPPAPRAQPPCSPADGDELPSWADIGAPDANGCFSVSRLCGDDALRIPPSAASAYALVTPMHAGRLHVTHDQPLSRVVDAFEDVLCWALSSRLSLSRNDCSDLSAVLVVPPTLNSREVRELAAVLCGRLRCRSLIVHSEVTAVAFSLSCPLAAVVLVGAHTCCVACVEDGAEVPTTAIVLPTGIEDVADALPWLARRATGADLSALSRRDCVSLVEAHCRCADTGGGEEPSPPDAPVTVLIPTQRGATQVTLWMGNADRLAPHGLFAPRLLGSRRAAVAARASRSLPPSDAAAAHEETFLTESGAVQVAPAPEAMPDGAADGLGLDAALAASAIAACPKDDARSRLLSCVLLAGGGSSLPGLARALAARTEARLSDGTRVSVTAVGLSAAWRGGALMAAAEATREAWARAAAVTEGVEVGKPGRYDAATTLVAKLNAYLS